MRSASSSPYSEAGSSFTRLILGAAACSAINTCCKFANSESIMNARIFPSSRLIELL
jgi:hypothetical protein